MSDLDTMIGAGRSAIGAFYKWWTGVVPVEACEPAYRDCPGTDATYVINNGVNCAGIINWMRVQAGYATVGGTLAYHDAINPWENYDDSKWYPVGTLLVQPFIEGVSEGHVAIVSRPNQLILQADVPNGVNELKTASTQNWHTPWTWAGWMPGVPKADYLPGWDGGVAGYPGNAATPQDTAAWMARVAEKIYGLPGILPVMCSYVELTGGWTAPGNVENVPGYLWNVDHCSVGWFQQQADDLGCGTFGWGTREQLINAEFALSRFLDAAWQISDQFDWKTAQGLGEWCQAVQRSAFPNAYRDKGYPGAQELLEGVTPTAEEALSMPVHQQTGWLDLDSLWQPEKSGRQHVWGEIQPDGTIKIRDWLE